MTFQAHSFKSAAGLLGIGVSTLYGLVSGGKIEARKLLSKTVIFEDEIQRFLSALPAVELGNSPLKGQKRKPRPPKLKEAGRG